MAKEITLTLDDDVAAALQVGSKGKDIETHVQSILVSAVAKSTGKPKAGDGALGKVQQAPSTPQEAALLAGREMLNRQSVALWICGELRSASDRAAGVLGGAFVDDFLTDLLKEYLKKWGDNPYCASLADKIFRHQGPLGSFSSRIDVARLFGIIGPQTHAELDSIREIRNICAHWTMSKNRDDFITISFEEPKVREWCEKLRFADGFTMSVIGGDGDEPTCARDKFILNVSMLGQQIMMCIDGITLGDLDQPGVRSLLR